MECSTLSDDYLDGIRDFLEFAFKNKSDDEKVPCPCKKFDGRGKCLRKAIAFVQSPVSKRALFSLMTLLQSKLLFSLTSSVSIPWIPQQQKIRGHTIVADIWNQPRNERIFDAFNSRNQAIGVEGRLASFLGTVVRNPDLTPLIAKTGDVSPKEQSKLFPPEAPHSDPKDDDCGFFEWYDPEYSGRAKEALHNLIIDKDNLKQHIMLLQQKNGILVDKLAKREDVIYRLEKENKRSFKKNAESYYLVL
ncbi:hypothetical protein Cni_G19866 [Canna indica]|uniref:Uncharacterized protein n=1 Tax=Canna indica TaxID=4628 RepID=A0AAQ3KN32_9LILI|nr:hypothetical protein Cni_G19866 [Canna indica]